MTKYALQLQYRLPTCVAVPVRVCFQFNRFARSRAKARAGARALLLRVIGSPDPYSKQTDGMGGAASSTSKTVILSKSEREGYDVDYLVK